MLSDQSDAAGKRDTATAERQLGKRPVEIVFHRRMSDHDLSEFSVEPKPTLERPYPFSSPSGLTIRPLLNHRCPQSGSLALYILQASPLIDGLFMIFKMPFPFKRSKINFGNTFDPHIVKG